MRLLHKILGVIRVVSSYPASSPSLLLSLSLSLLSLLSLLPATNRFVAAALRGSEYHATTL